MDLNALMNNLRVARHNRLEYYKDGKKCTRQFGEIYHDVVQAALFLRAKGLGRGSRIGILGKNSLEWIVMDLACLATGIVSIPLDVNQTVGAATLIGEYGLDLLLTNLESHAGGEATCRFAEAAAYRPDPSATQSFEPVSYGADDIFTIICTSGTSGKAKAVEVRKKSFDHLASGTQQLFSFNDKDRFLVFLPLHIYLERCYIYAAILLNFSVILTPLERVFASIQQDKPTVIIAVPYFFENVHKIFMEKIRANVLYSCCYRAYLLFKKMGLGFLFGNRFYPFSRLWGGRIRYLLTGSAPIAEEVLNFYQCMGVVLYEGYGMSEIGGMLTLNAPGNYRIGSVGKPFPGKEIRIDAEGQILVRSSCNANTRYYRSTPQENDAVYLPEGTVATGDLGHFDKDGFLYINGRIKDQIILSTGIKVQPQAIEDQFRREEALAGCVLYGDKKPYLVALLVPENAHAGDEVLRRALAAVNAGLPAHEKVRGFVRFPEKFTVQNGMLTTSLKLNRKSIYAKFEAEFEQLYQP